MPRVRVAVVDSGLVPSHPHVGGAVDTGVSLVAGVDDTLDRIGHGTAVAAAIREKAPEAELVPVKVFDRALRTDADTLARAIAWAADAGCVLINLSLGTANAEHREMLDAAVIDAAARGATVITPLEAGGVTYYPGAGGRAIAVVGDASIPRETLKLQTPNAQLVTASIYPRPIPGVPPERNLHGVSFAVANVTGLLAAALAAAPGSRVEDLLDSIGV